MRTVEDLIDACLEVHKQPCGCGAGVFTKLPTAVTLLACDCHQAFNENLAPINDRIGRGIHSYCTQCGKPQAFSIAYHYYVCGGCDKYFTLDFRDYNPAEYPPKTPLCRSCNVLSRPKRGRATGLSFN